jgi:3-hydroxymyristoyl/3-hydroxydecanoyl-(acyl carrier protein) dehydratase
MMTMRDSISAARVGNPQTNAEGLAIQEFRFRADDSTFAGHFPTRPILPGIFQIEIARQMAEGIVKHSLTVREITKAKFLWPIVPEETIRVELKLIQKEETIQARANFFVSGRSAGEAILQLGKLEKRKPQMDTDKHR